MKQSKPPVEVGWTACDVCSKMTVCTMRPSGVWTCEGCKP